MDQAQLLSRLQLVFQEHGYEGATLSKLAAHSGLGKASLYHHFPGGKAEIGATLLRGAVERLEKLAFAALRQNANPRQRLTEFVDGFATYTEDGASPCLIAAFSQGSAWVAHGDAVAEQFQSWRALLAATFQEAGYKPRRARREADALLGVLYGQLLLAKLSDDPGAFRRSIKRLKKSLLAG